MPRPPRATGMRSDHSPAARASACSVARRSSARFSWSSYAAGSASSGMSRSSTKRRIAARHASTSSGRRKSIARYSGSQLNTSSERSSGKNDAFSAGMACSAMVCGVQPSRAMHRAHRPRLAHQEDLVVAHREDLAVDVLRRVAGRNTASGAILAGVICFSFSTRACCSGVSVGIEPIMRLQANGAMQLERTLNFAMSSAIDFDSADDAELGGGVVGLAEVADQARGRRHVHERAAAPAP